MGFTSTLKFVNLGIRRRLFRKLKRPHHQWDMLKNMLDSLIKQERIQTTMAKAKELQQYAEEIILLAKKDTPEADLKVESMLRTSAARRKLYEILVPRYSVRTFYFTRIINQWRFRMRDAVNMAYIEYVDRPNELRPAKPVGFERILFIWQQMQFNRLNFRRYEAEARKLHLLDKNNELLSEDKIMRFIPPDPWSETPKKSSDLAKSTHSLKEFYSSQNEGRKAMEPFYVNIPSPNRRILKDKYLRKRSKQ
ncbi:putative 50S ribosomal protein L17 [Cardiosporidium cionae]|uniref:50S ribosomal protein L17 n=1 Tax=Cardiosporidium cionae TaxID=476202 RepID=A0ABQ7J4E8_9APIC|nr:putative 50S ribosomal protein L17 [Cardiosporidium cionae]|eukprot:KAF8817999.1 putative 50S ribosomal protein L17 [Cardiosporidium cionae]